MGQIEAYLVAGPSNDGGEDSTGSVISGKSSLDQARAVVAHKGGGLIVVTHDWALLEWSTRFEGQVETQGVKVQAGC